MTETFAALLQGLSVAMQPGNLLFAGIGVIALQAWAWRAQHRMFADEMFGGVIPGLTPVAGQPELRGPVPGGADGERETGQQGCLRESQRLRHYGQRQ